MVLTGAKSERGAMQAAKIFERTIQKVLLDSSADDQLKRENQDSGSDKGALVPTV